MINNDNDKKYDDNDENICNDENFENDKYE